MKTYKPNNSTLLYLNSSFNCTKSSSVTVTKSGNGTGYTSAPTVVITPAAGDLGYGASATIPAPASGVLSGTLVMVSTGKGYNTLPTVSLTGGGNPGCITGFSALVGGSGYIKPPTLSVTGGGGSGFVGTALIGNVTVSSTFTITTAGTGYIVGDTLVFTGGEGSGAVATVSSVSSGGITGISLTSAGSGYTSSPTISVISTAGTGAVITCALVGASVTGITIIDGGKNYATAPTFAFTAVSGGSGASATPTLTLGTTATFTVAFTRTFTYTWNIPDIVINDLGRLYAVNIVASGYTATTPYTFRVLGLQYNSHNSFYSDYGNPILSMAQQTNICSYGSVGSSNYNITLSPQTIRQIQISIDDSITTKDTGVVAALTFVIAIEIEEFDPVLTEIGDPYRESASKLKLQF
jgi:hypothetical protein